MCRWQGYQPWKPQPPIALKVCPGLYKVCFTIYIPVYCLPEEGDLSLKHVGEFIYVDNVILYKSCASVVNR